MGPHVNPLLWSVEAPDIVCRNYKACYNTVKAGTV